MMMSVLTKSIVICRRAFRIGHNNDDDEDEKGYTLMKKGQVELSVRANFQAS